MHMNDQTDYSLRVLLYLACRDKDQLANIQEIARTYSISENHLMKVVHKLAKKGYIETIRGHGGGLRLAKAPADINLGEVIRQTEENFYLVECFNAGTDCCIITPVCQLRTVLQEALGAFFQVLDRYTLADLTRNRQLYQIVFRQKAIKQPED
jgi:Rrf2 family nitric oxide-sensitive transcriptional repressor